MGWSGSAILLGKLPVLGRPINLDTSSYLTNTNSIFYVCFRFPGGVVGWCEGAG